MRTLIAGDHFVSSDAFREAIERELGADFGPVRDVMWAGEDMEGQHEQQQIMEKSGPEAVDAPDEILGGARGRRGAGRALRPGPRRGVRGRAGPQGGRRRPGGRGERQPRGGQQARGGGRQRRGPQRQRRRRAGGRAHALRDARHRPRRRGDQGRRLAGAVREPRVRAVRAHRRPDRPGRGRPPARAPAVGLRGAAAGL